MEKPPQKFFAGDFVIGKSYSSEYIQHPMTGIILKESSRSNWWGDNYTRWYEVLAENGKIVEEVEEYIELLIRK